MKVKQMVHVCLALWCLVLCVSAAHAVEGSLFIGAGGETGDKPQSKLWFNDGTWWAILPDGNGVYFYHKLQGGLFVKQTFPDAPVELSSNSARADVLWNGTHLFVLIYKGAATRLFKYSYNSLTQVYTRLPGFPVNLPLASGSETATIAQDSTGKLWLVYDPGSQIRVLWSTNPAHTAWETTGMVVYDPVDPDDIAAVVAFNNRIGVMWSNHLTDSFNFLVHIDGAPETTWEPMEVVSQGNDVADDHIHLAVTTDQDVLATIKTGRGNEIDLFVRWHDSGWDGPYFLHPNATRPIVVFDQDNEEVYTFYTGNMGSSATTIMYKKAKLSSLIDLTLTEGTALLTVPGVSLNDVTSTKQMANTTTGLLVAAKGGSYAYYKSLDITSTNLPPLASAGASVTSGPAPLTVQFTGSGTDPDGSVVTYAWNFGNGATATGQSPTHTYTAAGTYTARLTVTDNMGATGQATVLITVTVPPPVNQPPVVNAGPAQTLTLPASATLTATVSDDGLPTPPGALTLLWSKLNGPGTVSFGNATMANTTATFSTAGIYVLRLTANDGALATSADVTITVAAAPSVNQPPVVNAGSAQTLTLPASATLTAAVSDDGLPTPPGALTLLWSKLSGPGTVGFGNATMANTTATFSTAGTYVLRLTATDGALATSADVTITVAAAPSVNQPPVVNAGSDQLIPLSASAALAGTVSDDGLPGGVLTLTWGRVSGPEPVTFTNSAVAVTTATFPTPGSYVLRLTASDGALSAFDEVTVLVEGTGTTTVVETRIAASADDADESTTGVMKLTSSALSVGDKKAALRFPLAVPSGATIVQAYVQFTAYERNAESTTLLIEGEAKDTVLPFTSKSWDITNRPRTLMVIPWTVPAWPTTGAAGLDQRTPDLTPILQEIVDRPGWASGQAVGLILTGSGRRRATTYDGSNPAAAALLHVAYTLGPVENRPPTVTAGGNQSITLPQGATLAGTANDDGLPNGALTLLWSKLSGPGTVTFGNATMANTTAMFSTAGTYVLRLTAQDGALAASADVTITVGTAPPVNQPPVVNAGPAQTLTLPAGATLTATVSDDGLPTPPGAMTLLWSKLSGPGTVSFGNATMANTTATFSTAGTYVLRLTATDGALATSADVTITVAAAPLVNQPPVVNAGPDQLIPLAASATLAGTVSDDGLPGGPLTLTWSQTSGPGSVTFTNSAAAVTTATFPTPGSYLLRLTASDGALSAFDEVTVLVEATGATTVIETRIVASADDADESTSGAMKLTSSSLAVGDKKDGVRFLLAVPRGATIVQAYVQFTAYERNTEATTLLIEGVAQDTVLPFTTKAWDITNRPRTLMAVPWTVPAWPTTGAAGLDQRTPDLTPILQEIVDRPGWASGQAVGLILTGNGRRRATTYDNNPATAALLHVEYTLGPAHN